MKETLKAIGVFVPSVMSWDAVANAMRMLGQIASEPQPQGPQVPLTLKYGYRQKLALNLQRRTITNVNARVWTMVLPCWNICRSCM